MPRTHKRFYPEPLKEMIFTWRMEGLDYAKIRGRVADDVEYMKFAHKLTTKTLSNMIANMKRTRVKKAVKSGMRTSAIKKKFNTTETASQLRSKYGKNGNGKRGANEEEGMFAVTLVLPKGTFVVDVANALSGIEGAYIRM